MKCLLLQRTTEGVKKKPSLLFCIVMNYSYLCKYIMSPFEKVTIFRIVEKSAYTLFCTVGESDFFVK